MQPYYMLRPQGDVALIFIAVPSLQVKVPPRSAELVKVGLALMSCETLWPLPATQTWTQTSMLRMQCLRFLVRRLQNPCIKCQRAPRRGRLLLGHLHQRALSLSQVQQLLEQSHCQQVITKRLPSSQNRKQRLQNPVHCRSELRSAVGRKQERQSPQRANHWSSPSSHAQLIAGEGLEEGALEMGPRVGKPLQRPIQWNLVPM